VSFIQYERCVQKKSKQKITLVLTFKLLTGSRVGSSMAQSLSDSDLELLSESLELVDSTPLICAASNERLRTHMKNTQDHIT